MTAGEARFEPTWNPLGFDPKRPQNDVTEPAEESVSAKLKARLQRMWERSDLRLDGLLSESCTRWQPAADSR